MKNKISFVYRSCDQSKTQCVTQAIINPSIGSCVLFKMHP